MKNKKTDKFPSVLYVYPCDFDDGKPIYAVSETLDDISEANGTAVAEYLLQQRGTLQIEQKIVGMERQ